MRAKEAWDLAASCVQAINAVTDPDTRAELTRQRDAWIEVANELETNERKLNGSGPDRT